MSKATVRHRLLLVEAARWLEVTEQGANNHGQIVEMFQRTIGRAVGEPWCMSFVQFCLYWIDQYVPGKEHRLYRSEHCMTVWGHAPGWLRESKPWPGCIVIWQSGRNPTAGHTGIVEMAGDDYIITIEGNTGDDERRVIREGDGVYRKKRLTRGSGALKLVGYLNPWGDQDGNT